MPAQRGAVANRHGHLGRRQAGELGGVSLDAPSIRKSVGKQHRCWHDLRIGEGKRSHECRVDLLGRDVHAIAGQRARGAGVADNCHTVAEIECGARGGIDAHVAHRADDHYVRDARLFQDVLQSGVAEGIWVMLGQNGLAIDGCHGSNDIRTVRAGRERCICGTWGLVAEVDDLVLTVPRGSEDALRIPDGLVQVLQW